MKILQRFEADISRDLVTAKFWGQGSVRFRVMKQIRCGTQFQRSS